MRERLGKSILSAALFLFVVLGSASAQTVNPNAMKAFQASSGGANATWSVGPNNSWEANWLKEGQKMVYCYDQAGVLQQKKIVSALSAFPASVNTSVTAAYPSGKVQRAYKVVDRTNQKFYEVEVATVASTDRMRFSLEGKPIGKTSMAATPPAAGQLTASAATPVSVKPAASAAVAAKPAPVVAVAKPAPVVANSKPVSQPMAMRGEAATPAAKTDDLIDDDLGDLLEEDGDIDDLLDDDENWDDINLDEPLDDDSDLLEGTDELDSDLDLDDLDDDDGM